MEFTAQLGTCQLCLNILVKHFITFFENQILFIIYFELIFCLMSGNNLLFSDISQFYYIFIFGNNEKIREKMLDGNEH